MGALVDQVLNRTADKALVRYGTIESASGGLASVRMGSAVVENVTWLSGYLPSIGDRVAVLASGSGWLILGAVERVQRAYNEPETVLVQASHRGGLSRPLWSDSWDDVLATPGYDPKLPEPVSNPAWDSLYSRAYTADSEHFEDTGYYYASTGSGAVLNYVPSNGNKALFLWYPALSAQIPANAIVQSASLILRLWDPEPQWQTGPTAPAKDASIVVYPHAQPPVDGTATGQPPEYYFASGYEPIDAGIAHRGDLVTVPLSDEWVSALVTGALTGVSVWPGITSDRIVFADQRLRPSSGGPFNYITNDCFGIQVTYVTPYSEDG